MVKLVSVALVVGIAMATMGCTPPHPPEAPAAPQAAPPPPPPPPPAGPMAGGPGMGPHHPGHGGPPGPPGEHGMMGPHHEGAGGPMAHGPMPGMKKAHGKGRMGSRGGQMGHGQEMMGELGMLGVHFYPAPMVLRRAKDINLTPDQVTKIRQEMVTTHGRTIDIHAKLEHTKLEAARLLAADKVDEKAIHAQIDEAAKAQAEMHKLHVGTMLRIRNLLTAEQRQKLDEPKPRHERGAKPGMGPVGQADDMEDDDDDDDEEDEAQG